MKTYRSALTHLACCMMSLAFSASVQAQAPGFYLHPEDRVLFYGDSITDQRLYTQIIETYVITRYPKLPLTFINSGWGGDTVYGGGGGDIDTRLSRDVTPYKPTVITIMLGMNDGGYKEATTANDEKYFTGYRHILDTLKRDDSQARITVIDPSPYDNVTRPGPFGSATATYNDVMVGFGKWTNSYAREHGLTVADANTDFVQVLRKTEETDPALANQFLPDHIHPSFGGAMLLAEAVLKSWHARPVVASVSVNLDGTHAKLKAAEHAEVSELTSVGGGLRWTELDDALPLPFVQWRDMWGGGPAIGAAIQNSDITTSLNEEPLQVEGLKSGVYRFSIDGSEVGTFTDAQLERGINLALLKTPMTAQAMNVYQLTTEHGDLHYDRWRHLQVPLATYKMASAQTAMDALDQAEQSVVAEQRHEAQPKPHTFVLEPVR